MNYKFKVQHEDHTAGTFELSDVEAKRLCENSIERVINQSIRCLDDSDDPDARGPMTILLNSNVL